MSLDDQLRILCKEHDLASISVCMMQGHGRTWPQVTVQWYDENKSHGRGIATSEHGTPVGEGVKQAIERMNAERGKSAVISDLEAA